MKAGVAVVPIVCSPLDGIINLKRRKLGPGTVKVRVLAPIPTDGYGEKELSRLTELVRDRMREAILSLLSPSASSRVG